jgi:hypothetical protein
MIISNADKLVLQIALNKINQDRYENNIMFKDLEILSSKKVKMTLRVRNSRGPGHLVSHQGKRMVSAWHVHGYYFETLFRFAPNAVIDTMYGKVTREEGNWVDVNRGPSYFSDMCDCNFGPYEQVPIF